MWANVIKLFYGRNLQMFVKKLECLSLPILSSLMYVGKVRDYPNETPLVCSTLGYFPELTLKHWTMPEGLARDTHSSLLQTSVNYVRKQFYNIGPCLECEKVAWKDTKSH